MLFLQGIRWLFGRTTKKHDFWNVEEGQQELNKIVSSSVQNPDPAKVIIVLNNRHL
jgi:hypothetical protein